MAEQIVDRNKVESLMGDLREAVYHLKLFNKVDEINTYCEDLICQVTMTVESTVEHLNKVHAALVDEINKYREDLLGAKESLMQSPNQNYELEKNLNQELQRLSEEIDTLNSKISIRSTQICPGDLQAAENLTERTRNLKRQLRAQAFKDGFMQFQEFEQPQITLVGRLFKSPKDTQELNFKNLVLNDLLSRASAAFVGSLETGPERCRDAVCSMLFLRDGNLAVSIRRQSSFIWNFKTKQKLFEMAGNPRNYVCHFAQLTTGVLVGSRYGGSFDIWDLEAKQLIKTINSIREIYSLPVHALMNGNMVIEGSREVYILDPRLEEDHCLLFKIPRYCSCLCRSNRSKKKVLSNGLLAFTKFCEKGVYLEIWNPENAKMTMRSQITKHNDYSYMRLFENGDTIVFLRDGTLEIFNWKGEMMYKAVATHQFQLDEIFQWSNQTLRFIYFKNDSVPILTPPNEISSLKIDSSCLSGDGKYVALSSSGMLAVWSLPE